MLYAVRERSGPDPILTIDLRGRVIDEMEDIPVAGSGGETLRPGPAISMELAALLEALITAGQRFILVNGSLMESLGPTCAMALCAYGHRLARAGGALVCCAFPSHLGRLAEIMPCLYATNEQEGRALCRAQPGASGILWTGALEVKRRTLDSGVTVLSLTGAYWSEPAYAELAGAVRDLTTEGLILDATMLTAVAPKGVGPMVKLVRELQEAGIRFCMCGLKSLPGTFLSSSGLLKLIPYFDTVESALTALRGQTQSSVTEESQKASFEDEPLEIDDIDDVEHFNRLRSEDPGRNLTERYLYFLNVNSTLAKQRFHFVPAIAKAGFTTIEVPQRRLAYSVGWWYSHSYPDLMLVAGSAGVGIPQLRTVLERMGEGLRGIEPADYASWISNPPSFLAPRLAHLNQLAKEAVSDLGLSCRDLATASSEFLERYPYTYGWEFYLQFSDESLVPLLMGQLR